MPLPDNAILDFETLDYKIQPSLTFKLDWESSSIKGKIDGFDAIVQSVYKNFITERYAYPIYSSNYGIELERFIGKDFDYIKSDMERTVIELLLMDDRINSITDFNMEKTGVDSALVSFLINTKLGSKLFSTEVNI